MLEEEKRRKSDVGKSDLVPAELDGVATDVVEVGKIEALVFNTKTRPALPGFSIGPSSHYRRDLRVHRARHSSRQFTAR